MATKTTNYNLIKPDLTDDADIRVINGNMDVLDNQLKTVADSVVSGDKNAYTNISVSSDYTWKFTKGSGANVSYNTIKKAISADGVSWTGTYKPNVDSAKYSQLQYHFGTIPYKGSSTGTLDCGTLKFNHWGASPYNTALSVPNNSGNRPFLSYQDGTAGTDYTTYKELAWKSDTDAKLDKTGGNVTGAIRTTDNIYKSSNNSVLTLSGSTDAKHGGRINLSGEKEGGKGFVQLTADNGTTSNVMQLYPNNGNYSFNGMGAYFNSSNNVFHIGNNDTPKLALNKSGDLQVAQANSNNFNKVLTRNLYIGDWDGAWAYQWNDLLIQGGRVRGVDAMTNYTLPRAYNNVNEYILYVSDSNPGEALCGYTPSAKKISNTTIAMRFMPSRFITWLTIGGWAQ